MIKLVLGTGVYYYQLITDLQNSGVGCRLWEQRGFIDNVEGVAYLNFF